MLFHKKKINISVIKIQCKWRVYKAMQYLSNLRKKKRDLDKTIDGDQHRSLVGFEHSSDGPYIKEICFEKDTVNGMIVIRQLVNPNTQIVHTHIF